MLDWIENEHNLIEQKIFLDAEAAAKHSKEVKHA
jgi:hypothetical protein